MKDKELDGEMKGLGDLVAKVTKVTGIDKVVDVVAKNFYFLSSDADTLL